MHAGKEFINEAYRALFHTDYKRAVDLFKKAISRDPNNGSYYYKLSVTYARNNNLAGAMEAVNHALRLCPENKIYQQHASVIEGRILSQKALEMAELGDDSARDLLEASIHLDPLNTQSRLLYAWLLHEQGDYEGAVHSLNELLALDPTHREAQELLKRSCFLLKKSKS